MQHRSVCPADAQLRQAVVVQLDRPLPSRLHGDDIRLDILRALVREETARAGFQGLDRLYRSFKGR